MTKEELIKLNEKLIVEKTFLKEQGDNLRQEFAKAFDWYVQETRYDAEKELKTPTWEEIFVEIGKLLSVKRFYDMDNKVKGIETILNDVMEQRSEVAQR